ncbi:MAG TPA: cell wall hydrolase, partial [Sphingomicrobium sp.]|nr:cell wall hydrolase [Sphingomicrobium sp.]
MIKLLGSRGASAVMGFFMLTVASAAPAQTAETTTAAPIAAAVEAAKVDTTAKPLGTSTPVVAAVRQAVTTAASAVTTTVGKVFGATPAVARPAQLTVKRDIAKEVAWLHSAGWPLYALVHRVSSLDNVAPPLDEQANCIAVAVYHEARGESLEGQLAVARVIMNRAASGKYPPTWCGTVK